MFHFRSLLTYTCLIFAYDSTIGILNGQTSLFEERLHDSSETFNIKSVIDEYGNDLSNANTKESAEWLNVAAQQWRDEVSCNGTFVASRGRIYVSTSVPTREAILGFDDWQVDYKGRFAKEGDYFYYQSTITPETLKNVSDNEAGNDEEILSSKNVTLHHNREHHVLTVTHNLDGTVSFPATRGIDPTIAPFWTIGGYGNNDVIGLESPQDDRIFKFKKGSSTNEDYSTIRRFAYFRDKPETKTFSEHEFSFRHLGKYPLLMECFVIQGSSPSELRFKWLFFDDFIQVGDDSGNYFPKVCYRVFGPGIDSNGKHFFDIRKWKTDNVSGNVAETDLEMDIPVRTSIHGIKVGKLKLPARLILKEFDNSILAKPGKEAESRKPGSKTRRSDSLSSSKNSSIFAWIGGAVVFVFGVFLVTAGLRKIRQ